MAYSSYRRDAGGPSSPPLLPKSSGRSSYFPEQSSEVREEESSSYNGSSGSFNSALYDQNNYNSNDSINRYSNNHNNSYHSNRNGPNTTSASYGVQKQQQQQQDFKLYETFPSTRSVPFWDRTPLGSSVLVRSIDILPVLQIDSENIYYVLKESLDHSESALINFNFDRSVFLKPISSSSSSEAANSPTMMAIKSNILHSGNPFAFRMISPNNAKALQSAHSSSFGSSASSSNSNNILLSIPFYIRPQSEDNFKFDLASSRLLIDNLLRSLSSSPSLSLRSCIRIRCMGFAVGHNDNTSMSGTYRFEAILPNISFANVPLKRIPLLSTPLSEKLTSSHRSSGLEHKNFKGLEPYRGPTSGFLSMSSNRRAIPILETDSASLARCPVVGVWVFVSELDSSISSSSKSEYNGSTGEVTNIVFHPAVWAACTRYSQSEQIQKANADPSTFLLMVFSESDYNCWEVSGLSAAVLPPSSDSSEMDYTSESNVFNRFVCMDFTVDLSCEKARDGAWVSEPVLCKFRVLARSEYKESFRNSMGVDLSKVKQAVERDQRHIPQPDSVLRSSSSSMTKSSSNSFTSGGALDLETGSMGETTPQPRSFVPVSYSPAKGSSSAADTSANPISNASNGSNFRYSTESSISKLLVATSSEVASSGLSTHSPLRSSQSGHSPVGAASNSTSKTSTAAVDMFPASVVLSQQLEISELRNEVAQLKALVHQLSSSVSASMNGGSGSLSMTQIAKGSRSSSESMNNVRSSFSNAKSIDLESYNGTSGKPAPAVVRSNDSFNSSQQHPVRGSKDDRYFASSYADSEGEDEDEGYDEYDGEDVTSGRDEDRYEYYSDEEATGGGGKGRDAPLEDRYDEDEDEDENDGFSRAAMDSQVLFGNGDSHLLKYSAKVNPLSAQLKDMPKIVLETVSFDDDFQEEEEAKGISNSNNKNNNISNDSTTNNYVNNDNDKDTSKSTPSRSSTYNTSISSSKSSSKSSSNSNDKTSSGNRRSDASSQPTTPIADRSKSPSILALQLDAVASHSKSTSATKRDKNSPIITNNSNNANNNNLVFRDLSLTGESPSTFAESESILAIESKYLHARK